MAVEALLDRLDGVRETGSNRFVARCPAHADRTPSLAITQVDDGRVLIHCFAGCEPLEILEAIGLSFTDVMPERIQREDRLTTLYRPFDARQVLECIWHEVIVVTIVAETLNAHVAAEERSRLLLAVSRIETAIATAGSREPRPGIRAMRRAS